MITGDRPSLRKASSTHASTPGRADRPTSWRTFLKSHADVIVATDFFTTEVWTARGLATYHTLFFIDIATRAVHIAGTTTSPNTAFMSEVARRITNPTNGFLADKGYLILDRDGKYCSPFKSIIENAGVEIATIAFLSPVTFRPFASRMTRTRAQKSRMSVQTARNASGGKSEWGI